MRKIVAFTGLKGSGKDTAAMFFCKQFPSTRQVAFADPIKQFVMSLFNLSSVSEYDTFKRGYLNYNGRGEVSGRHVVREIGMLMRNYDMNQFTQYVEGQLDDHPNTTFCITDLRFYNEVVMLRKRQAVVVEIVNPRVPKGDDHVTEQGIDRWFIDHTIYNDSTIEVFEERVSNLFKQIM